MNELTAAIVGCGKQHAEAYHLATAGRLAACCDQFGIAARYSDLETMLREVRPDLLHIVALPTIRWSISWRLRCVTRHALS